MRPQLSRIGVFRENLLNPSEGLLRRRLWRYSTCHDVDPRRAPHMFVLHLRISRIVDPEWRYCWAEQTLRDVSHPMRVFWIEPPRVVLYDRPHARNVAPKSGLQQLVIDFWLYDVFEEVLGNIDVLCPFWNQAERTADLTCHRLAVVAERQAHRHNIPVIFLFVNDRDLGRDRAIEVHYDLFGVKGVVIVGVVPVDRAGRYKPFLIGGGRIGQRLDRRLTNFRIIEVQLAVSCDDVLAAIGDQKVIEHVVRIVAIGGDLESEAIDLAFPLSSQLSVYILEEVIISVPGLWNILDLVTGLLDQRPPYVVWQCRSGIGHAVIVPLFLFVIVTECGESAQSRCIPSFVIR